MPTSYTERILIGVPAASAATFRTWWTNNVDAGDTGIFTVGLNASGLNADAAQFFVSCVALVPADAFKILVRLANLAGVAPPTAQMTKAQLLQWIQDNRAAIVANTGVRMWRSDNDAVWDDFRALIAGFGMKFRGSLG